MLERHFRRACTPERFDLYHEPNFLPLPTSVPTVVTVHDVSALRFPEWHPPDRVALHERHLRQNLSQFCHILTVSEAMREDVVRELGVSAERVTAVPNGVGPEFQPRPAAEVEAVRRRLALPAQFLLHVGTLEPRKNLLTLMRAYCALDAATRDRCPLVLVGPWGWKAESIREYYADVARHRGVRHLGYVNDADLPAVYTSARALAFPTHYEGFGLPPLEMMACGGAVLASTAAAVREVVGDRACLLDPSDNDGWRAALARVIVDGDWRNELRRGTRERAAQFSWDRCARATLAVYQRVCDGSRQTVTSGSAAEWSESARERPTR
jgi:alpha-1,3-rhamnosyl/mannosyltransferase